MPTEAPPTIRVPVIRPLIPLAASSGIGSEKIRSPVTDTGCPVLYLHALWSQPILDLDSANGFEVPVRGQEDESVLASERRNQQIELGHDATNGT